MTIQNTLLHPGAILSGSLLLLSLLPKAHCAESSAPQEIRNRWPVGAALLYVAESGPVKKGSVVAVLDPAPLVAEVERLEGLLRKAQAEQKSLQEQLGKAKDGEDLVRKQAKEAEEAQKVFAEHDGNINELGLQQAVTDTSSAYDQELVRFNARDKLLQEGFIQKPEYELQGSKLRSAKLAADLARAKFERWQKFEKPHKEAELAQKLEEAKAAAKKTEAESAANREKLAARLGEMSKQIASFQGAVNAAREELGTVAQTAAGTGNFQFRPEEAGPPLKAGSLVGPGETIGRVAP
jgi:multidrug resistance efflux pump